MKIGFFRYSLFNRGGDRLSLEFANHLSRTGHDVTLYVAKLETVFGIEATVNVVKVDVDSRAEFLLRAAKARLSQDIVVVDIIHLAGLLSRNNKVVYYAQAYDVEYYANPFSRWLISYLYHRESRSSRDIIVMSRHLTDILCRKHGFRNVHTLTTGIDHKLFYPEPDDDLIAIKGGRKALVFMSRGDVYRKGRDLGEQLIDRLGRSWADKMEVWICGDHYDPQLPGLNVRNFGTVSDSRLRQVLSSADIFLYPSRHEGFGLFPLEAMACGCVAVTSEAIPYAKDCPVILSSGVGDVAAMARNIERLVLDEAYYRELQAGVASYAALYDFEETKKQFEAALMSVVRAQCASA